MEGRLLKYGYKPLSKMPGKLDKVIKMRFLPTSRIEYMSLNQFRSRVARGVYKEVDPELGTSKYKATDTGISLAELNSMAIPRWDRADDATKKLAVEHAKILWPLVQQHRQASIKWERNAFRGNEAKLFAITAILKKFKFDREHMAALYIIRDGNPEFRYINENTIHLLESMIGAIFYGDEFKHDYTDSDKAMSFATEQWDEMGIRFWKDNDHFIGELDNRPSHKPHPAVADLTKKKKGAGFFPYLNTSELDLSPAGIFTEFNPENYTTNCLIRSLQVFSLSEKTIQSLSSMIQTAVIPFDQFQLIANCLRTEIAVHHWSDKHQKNKNCKHYVPKGPLSKSHARIDLWERFGHVCPYTKHTYNGKGVWITNIVQDLLQKRQLVEMTPAQIQQAWYMRIKERELQAIPYDEKICVNDRLTWVTPEKIYRGIEAMIDQICEEPIDPYPLVLPLSESELDLILEHDDLKKLPYGKKEELWSSLRIQVAEIFGLLLEKFSTLANLGQAILQKTGCYEGVVELRGPPCHFIRACMTSPMCQTENGVPVRVTGEVEQIDRHGSYPAIYKSFMGIPKGRPQCVTSYDEATFAKFDYYYICVDIKAIRDSSPFRLPLKIGLNYLDKYFFEAMVKGDYCDWEFKSAYEFHQGFNTKIRQLTDKLWLWRENWQKGSPMELIVKRLMNTLWGKSVARDLPVKTRILNAKEMTGCVRHNGALIYSVKELDKDRWEVRILKPLRSTFRVPQFGVNIMSWSRWSMHEVINRALSNGIHIYYTNTDSLVLMKKDVEKLNGLYQGKLIGTIMGQMSSELSAPARLFIVLSPKKYIACLMDGKMKVRYRPKKVAEDEWEAWFEAKFIEKTSQ
jgi:hypothetical protein